MRLQLLLLLVFLSPGYSLAASPTKAVYLTWQSTDTATTMVINFVTETKVTAPEVLVSSSGRAHKRYEKKWSVSSERMIAATPLHIYSYELNQLSPATLYTFRFLWPDSAPTEYKFKTLPQDDSPIEIVTGGDLSVNKDLIPVSQAALTDKTLALLLGGDLAYEDGNPAKYDRWLKLFDLLNEAMLTPDGRLLPMIIAIGNHEAIAKKAADPLVKAPFYLQLFPQNRLLTYFKRNLGALATVMVLDSGHVYEHGKAQKEWLEASLKEEQQKKYRFALYHVPLFPSFRDYEEDGSKKGRDAWLPLFDQFQLTAAFENHDHALKRSKMIRNEKVVSRAGTVYIGDGCWGVAPRPASSDRWYLDVAKVEKHLWRISIDKEGLLFKAINKNAVVVDEFTLKNNQVK